MNYNVNGRYFVRISLSFPRSYSAQPRLPFGMLTSMIVSYTSDLNLLFVAQTGNCRAEHGEPNLTSVKPMVASPSIMPLTFVRCVLMLRYRSTATSRCPCLLKAVGLRREESGIRLQIRLTYNSRKYLE